VFNLFNNVLISKIKNVPFFYCLNLKTPLSTNITKLAGEFKLHTLKKVTEQAFNITKSIYQIFNKLKLKHIETVHTVT